MRVEGILVRKLLWVILDVEVILWYRTNMNKSLVNKVTTKGQVVIPKEIRDKFKIDSSSNLIFEDKIDYIAIRKAPETKDIFGIVKTKKRASLQDLDKAILRGRRKDLLKKLAK